MNENEILQKQVDALEKLLQIKEAIIQEHETKIQRLENDIARTNNYPYPGLTVPYIPPQPVPMPFIGGGGMNFDPCPGASGFPNHHEYPQVWHGTTPPPCNKCGKTQPNPTWTITSSTNMSMLEDEERALGTITDIANKKGV